MGDYVYKLLLIILKSIIKDYQILYERYPKKYCSIELFGGLYEK